MQKYSQTYTELVNMILGLSNYQRSQVLGIIRKFLRNQSSEPYYAIRRSNKLEAAIIMFFLGFVFGILFWGGLDIAFEYFDTLPNR